MAKVFLRACEFNFLCCFFVDSKNQYTSNNYLFMLYLSFYLQVSWEKNTGFNNAHFGSFLDLE